MALAYESFDKADVAETLTLLKGCPPKLRGWEWHHLSRLCDTDLLRFEARTADPQDWGDPWDLHTLSGQLVFSPDGASLCAANQYWGSAVFDSRSGQRVISFSTNWDIGQFSEDGRFYFKCPSRENAGQIFELSSGATRAIPVPGEDSHHSWISERNLSRNAEWMTWSSNSTVIMTCLQKGGGTRSLPLAEGSWVETISRDGRWLSPRSGAGVFEDTAAPSVPLHLAGMDRDWRPWTAVTQSGFGM